MTMRFAKALVVVLCSGCWWNQPRQTDIMSMPPICDLPTPVLTTPLARLPGAVPVDPDASTLVGYVADSAGHALPAAQVLLDPPMNLGPTIPVPFAVTDSVGAFVLAPITPGRHHLMIRAISYIAQRPAILLRPGHADTLQVHLRYYNCVGY